MSKVLAQTVGRRKSAVARVRLTSGKGAITINKRPIEQYFPTDLQKAILLEPFQTVSAEGQYDLTITVSGGGVTGQAGAIRLGIARALQKVDGDFRQPLKKIGLLTRDAREVERKKYGQPGARKKFQFSKR